MRTLQVAGAAPVGADEKKLAIIWDDDDYDVRVVAPDGPVIGRIYKMVHSPSGTPWFWALNLFPAVAADSGAAETREVAMAACKERWERYLGLRCSIQRHALGCTRFG